MASPSPAPPPVGHRFPRVLGSVGGASAGPVLVMTGGLHGNEPAGVLAARRVLDTLAREERPVSGRVVAVAGNLGALEQGVRFRNRDLNRKWFPDRLRELYALAPGEASPEDLEQRELDELYRSFLALADAESREVVFLDLHTTSGGGPPFVGFADSLQNLSLGLELPATTILGLAEVLDGPMLNYFADLGYPCVVVEGGRHDDPAAVDILESAIWIFLVAVGCLEVDAVPDMATHRERLEAASAGMPRVVEIRYRHHIDPGDEFVMEPGFHSFEAIERGDLLARDRNGEIRARQSGRLLMPLYQGLGEDGFFIAREVGKIHLGTAILLRRVGAARLLPLLPGVRRHPAWPDRFEVDLEKAGPITVGIFHMLGYRRLRPEGDHFVFSNRATLPG